MNVRDVPVEYRELPVALIDAPVLPARSSMDDQKLDELIADVRAKGVLVPLSVVRNGDRYEVIAGHRRRIAAGRANLVTVRCLIYPTKANALEAVKYSENRFREDLNAADEAIYFTELLERDCGGDVDQLCAQLGEKRGYVEGRLRLFAGDENIFHELQAGQISIGMAHELNKCTDEQYRRYLLHQAIVGGATVNVVGAWVMDWKRSAQAASGAPLPVASSAPAGPVPELNYFTCCVCRGTDNVHRMRPINVHDYCELAVLEKLLATYHGESA
jgi:ParB/RepB/Spo0J family partition protein